MLQCRADYIEILASGIAFVSSKTSVEPKTNLLFALTKKKSSVVTSHKMKVELKAGNNSSTWQV